MKTTDKLYIMAAALMCGFVFSSMPLFAQQAPAPTVPMPAKSVPLANPQPLSARGAPAE